MIERMNWDILRNVEETEEAEAELLDEEGNWKGKVKLRSDAYDEGSRGIHDGESDAESSSVSNDTGTESEPLDPETKRSHSSSLDGYVSF
jgi:hypothetical protein